MKILIRENIILVVSGQHKETITGFRIMMIQNFIITHSYSPSLLNLSMAVCRIEQGPDHLNIAPL